MWSFTILADRSLYMTLFNVMWGSDYSSNQQPNLRTSGCECFLVVRRNAQGEVLSELIRKMIERAEWGRRAKSTEKCCSKWGVPGPTVPLIKMLTLGGGSSSSRVLLVPSTGSRCDLWPRGTRASQLLSRQPWVNGGMMRACVRLLGCTWALFDFSIAWVGWFFPKAGLFSSLHASLNSHRRGKNSFRLASK